MEGAGRVTGQEWSRVWNEGGVQDGRVVQPVQPSLVGLRPAPQPSLQTCLLRGSPLLLEKGWGAGDWEEEPEEGRGLPHSGFLGPGPLT